MKITTLIENKPSPSQPDLLTEHGLSLYIELNGHQILFDAGGSGHFADNARRLNVNLESVDLAVLSHHHYDHSDGLPLFLSLNKNAPLYLNQTPQGEPWFKALGFIRRYVGPDPTLFQDFADRLTFLDQLEEVLPGVYLFPDILTRYPQPKGNRYLYQVQEGGWIHDDFHHELILAIVENEQLVIFSGCAHTGVLNMIATVREKLPDPPIKAVIGGFHLVGLPFLNTMAGSRKEIQEIGRQVLSYQVQTTYSGHCTGEKAFHVLKDLMGDRLQDLHTGTVLEL